MNIKKKIRKAYESVPLPAAEDVLPEGAFEKKEKRGFAFYRPVIYVAAALCICVIVTVAAVMARPDDVPIADIQVDTLLDSATITELFTKDDFIVTEEVNTDEPAPSTTCEEVYAYSPPNFAASEEPNGDGTDASGPRKVLVKRSDGKVLVIVELVYLTKSEVDKSFEEVYGFDASVFMDDNRLIEEGIPLILGYEYREGDEYDEVVTQFVNEVRENWSTLKDKMKEEQCDIILKDCNLNSDDIYSINYFLYIYVDTERIDALKNHELVDDVFLWEDFNFVQINHD